MSDTLTKIVVDCSTGETEILPLSADEITQREADAKAYAEQKAIEDAELAAKEAAKESAMSKLKALGLTVDEVKSILG